jgi:hypothetical protein
MFLSINYGQPRDQINWFPWILITFALHHVSMWFSSVIPSRNYMGFDEGKHLEITH